MNILILDIYSAFIVHKKGVLLTLHKGHISGNTEKVKATFQEFQVLSLPKLWICTAKRRSRDLRMGLPAIASPHSLP